MNNTGDVDLLTTFKKLLAKSKSQETLLEQYAAIINSRDSEIEMLQKMLADANEYCSSMDNRLNELNELQQYVNELQQQVAASGHMPAGQPQLEGNKTDVEEQFENLKRSYAYLQSQLTDLQIRSLDMNQRNLLLQQQNRRIAELESLLANTGEEKDVSK